MRRYISRTVLQFAPTWRSACFSPYRSILEPYAPPWGYDDFGERSRVPLWDISDGCILWLPSSDIISPEALPDPGSKDRPPEGLDDPGYDHPILVLEVDIKGPTSGIVYYLQMSTFSDAGGVDSYLLKKLGAFNNMFKQPLTDTIFPLAKRTDNNQDHRGKRVLHLEGESFRGKNTSMCKGACVVASRIHAFDARALRNYHRVSKDCAGHRRGKMHDGWRYRLDEASFRIVGDTIGLRRLPWVNSGTEMWDHFIEHTGIGTPDQLERLRFLRICAQERRLKDPYQMEWQPEAGKRYLPVHSYGNSVD